MALSIARRVNAASVIVKDSNQPDFEGYRLTNSQWGDVQEQPNYNAQVALAAQYDAENRGKDDSDDESPRVEPPAPASAPGQPAQGGGVQAGVSGGLGQQQPASQDVRTR